jgi:outer membrane immunogenic protein
MSKYLLVAAACVSSMAIGLDSASADELGQWNGLYGGVHVGMSHGGSSDATGSINSFSLDGSFQHDPAILGGAQIGYNFQNGRFVFGLEADFSGADLSSDSGALLDLGIIQIGTFTSEVDWFGTVRGRAGILLDDNFLFYGTGGLAYGHVTNSIGYSIGICPKFCVADSESGDEVRVGYTVGAGVETNVNDSVKVKLEYLYVDLGSGEFFSDTIGRSDIAASSDVDFHVARVGVNIDFDSPMLGQ